MDLLQYIDQSPSAFHAVSTLEQQFLDHGFERLFERDTWNIKSGQNYYCIRQDASIVAFKIPKQGKDLPFRIVGAHTDSPCLKLKSKPEIQLENYQMAGVEVYGGALWNSWLDRDLDLAGILYYQHNAKTHSKLINLDLKARIPQLAIHLDRGVNDALKLNPQQHLRPLLGHQDSIYTLLQKQIPLNSQILSWDLSFYDAQKSSKGGSQQEWIYAARLDNLAMVHAATEAMLNTTANNSIQVAAFFNHEEIGSQSVEGANSNFLPQILKRIHNSLGPQSEQGTRLSTSRFLSADMAHAIHPNYPDRHDPQHKPLMGHGPVLKTNVNMRYATDAEGSAYLKNLCIENDIPLQDFQGNNTISCGSTIGPMSAAQMGISSIDIGNPMLSMHSAREMAHLKDHEKMIQLMKVWYD